MLNLTELRQNENVRRILGNVEIATVIKKINGRKLKQVERNYLSRSIRPKLIGAKLLTQQNILDLIKKTNKIKKSNIIFNLSKFGYDLISNYNFSYKENLKLEDLITIIIADCPESRYIESIPILLLKNKINPLLLLELALKYNIKNQIGYLLETSFIIAKKFRISKKIDYLNDLLEYLGLYKQNELIILGYDADNLYKEFLRKTSPIRIKKWNLLGRYFDEDFVHNAGVYL